MWSVKRSFGNSLLVLAAMFAAVLSGCGGGGGGGGGSTPPPVPAITSINGSATASGSPNTNFIVYGSGFGTLTTATAGYSVDFRDLATNNVVATATVNFTGSNWTDTYIKAIVPNTLTAGTTYNVTVTTPGGTSNKVSFLVVASVAFSPSTIAWASTTPLSTAMQGFPTVVAPITSAGATKAYIYTLGGNTAVSGTASGKNNNIATVYISTVNDGTGGTTAGTVGVWSSGTALPAARGFAAGAVANGFNSSVAGNGTVYLIGGLDNTGASTATVYFASLNSDGTIPAAATAGTWSTTTALPAARSALGAAVYQGRLYVAGGADATGAATSTVWSALINADGTLGAWSTLPALPASIAFHRLVTTGGVLYALGGTATASVDPISNAQSAGSSSAVYYNPINPDGSLAAAWTTNANSLIKTVEKHTVVPVGSFVLVSGGLYAGASTGSNEESYSQQSTTDGVSLGAFTGATGAHTITGTTGGYNFFNHSAAVYVDPTGKPHVLILGGQSISTGASALQTGVWYMQ